MTAVSRLLLSAAAPLLMAALWMDDQPSHGPYESPVVAPPPLSVPVTGREVGERGAPRLNPVPPDKRSLELGGKLFEINCAMCHGRSSAKPGPVGLKLSPPAPNLGKGMLEGLGDSRIFDAVTFGFGRMPPFRDKLTARERWSLVNFLRSRN